ncbi:hypothetical protein HY440_00190 [Candidatus Microgenomates bacterium]|nr:hypothetical protein [Candidatus Microgenomates bacterium]
MSLFGNGRKELAKTLLAGLLGVAILVEAAALAWIMYEFETWSRILLLVNLSTVGVLTMGALVRKVAVIENWLFPSRPKDDGSDHDPPDDESYPPSPDDGGQEVPMPAVMRQIDATAADAWRQMENDPSQD